MGTKKFIELEVGDVIVPVPGMEITVTEAPVLTKTDDGENYTLKKGYGMVMKLVWLGFMIPLLT
ncbi:hypothetical protein ACLH17_27480 [Klebsiella pasteurii]|uniref:hypothetical protein n=1 Tax=Klebsiella TaxID=570 RepID=UPI0032B3838B